MKLRSEKFDPRVNVEVIKNFKLIRVNVRRGSQISVCCRENNLRDFFLCFADRASQYNLSN